MKVKYIRVSTEEQNIERQAINTKDFKKVYTDKQSGALEFKERKAGAQLIKELSNITEVHVNAIDRLGRNILDILNVVKLFTDSGVNLYVENLGMYSLIDGKENPTFKLIVSVLGNVAEMERNNMLERQKQGIEIAKAKGTYKGRLYGSRMTNEQLLDKYKNVVRELKQGQSIRRTARLSNCSVGTVQKIKTLL